MRYVKETNEPYEVEGAAIKDNSNLAKYFAMIPNCIYDMGLSSYAIHLYGYFKRVTGETGVCFQSVTTIAKNCGVSRTTVVRAKSELLNARIYDKPIIEIKEAPLTGGGRPLHHITLTDIWDENKRHFSELYASNKQSPPQELAKSTTETSSSSDGLCKVHHRNLQVPVVDSKNNPIKKNPYKKNARKKNREEEPKEKETPLSGNGNLPLTEDAKGETDMDYLEDVAARMNKKKPISLRMAERFLQLSTKNDDAELTDAQRRAFTREHENAMTFAGYDQRVFPADQAVACVDKVFKEFEGGNYSYPSEGYKHQLSRLLTMGMHGVPADRDVVKIW